jgi:hypothetical protein
MKSHNSREPCRCHVLTIGQPENTGTTENTKTIRENLILLYTHLWARRQWHGRFKTFTFWKAQNGATQPNHHNTFRTPVEQAFWKAGVVHDTPATGVLADAHPKALLLFNLKLAA